MDNIYSIRKSSMNDAEFLADVIISAEKSMTKNLGLGNLFELSEKDIKKLIISMLKEDIDGCEFSISSFFVAYFDEKPVAALGGWLEGYHDGMSSSMLKSNLIRTTFPTENLTKINSKLEIIKDIQIERENGMYQLEYSYVVDEHRGKRLTQQLMKAHLEYAKSLKPVVRKAQLHVFENNEIIIKVHQRSGFHIAERFVSNNKDVLLYFPYNVKLLMEKALLDE